MIIKIKNLRIETSLGIYEWEKTYQRTLIFNAEIETESNKSMSSDKIEDTIDYDIITNLICDYVKNNYCHLIEKMLGDILNLIMEDKRIKRCSLEIDKLKVYDFVDSYSVKDSKVRI